MAPSRPRPCASPRRRGSRSSRRARPSSPRRLRARAAAPASPPPKRARRRAGDDGRPPPPPSPAALTPRSNALTATADADLADLSPAGAPDGAAEGDAPASYERLLDVLARAEGDAALRTMIARAVCTHNDYKMREFLKLEGEYAAEVTRLLEIQELEMSSLGLPEEKRKEAREKPEGALADALKMRSQLKHAAENARRLVDAFYTQGGRLRDAGVGENVARLLAELRAALKRLESYKDTAPRALDIVSKTVLAFVANPLCLQNRFINLMVLGSPGTGKTTICERIAQVFVAARIFHNPLATKSKADFIGSHLGETAPRTNEALRTNLDGVTFIDEAYDLTSLDPERGDVDVYGQEFAGALVAFMTRFKGLYCMIVGGYADKMRDQFLRGNEGLDRRFPYRCHMADVSPASFAKIVAAQVRKHMGYTDSEEHGAPAAVDRNLSERARRYLEGLVARTRAAGGPRVRALLANQAGSAANLGEFVALYRDSSGAQFDAMAAASKSTPRESVEACGARVAAMVRLHREPITLRVLRGALRMWIEQSAFGESPDAALAEWRVLDEALLRDVAGVSDDPPPVAVAAGAGAAGGAGGAGGARTRRGA